MHSAGAARGHVGHGPHAQQWRGPARPARATRDGGSATALLGELTAARCRCTGDNKERAAHRRRDNSATRQRRASGEAAGAVVRVTRRRTVAVGTAGARQSLLGGRARGGRAIGRRARGGRGDGGAREEGLSGRAACCLDIGFKPRSTVRRVEDMRQWRAAVRAQRGAWRLTGGTAR
jgi:hypothetical protein